MAQHNGFDLPVFLPKPSGEFVPRPLRERMPLRQRTKRSGMVNAPTGRHHYVLSIRTRFTLQLQENGA
jgi:hypothetical protein